MDAYTVLRVDPHSYDTHSHIMELTRHRNASPSILLEVLVFFKLLF
jgi:hypothetical protein